jgi:hydroxymethylpyrimidine pyrophosphatase-like HAD family hydrolase
MRTLYVSDLDGTLLRSDERTSGYTNRTVNRLVGEGMLFSYATARSFQTARKVTAGLEAEIPLIVYNGAAVADNRDGSFLQMNFFGGEAAEILDELEACGVFPIVYAVAGGREMFSYLPARCTRGMRAFLETRKNDRRANPVATRRTLRAGDIFYFTCIDEREKLLPLYEKYREGDLTRDEYMKQRSEINTKVEELQNKVQAIEARRMIKKNGNAKVDLLSELIHQYQDVKTFTKELERIFVEQVLVYDAEHIKIKWKFDDVFAALLGNE